jgi:hypothetical protein
MQIMSRALAALVALVLTVDCAHAGDLNGSLGLTFAHTPFNGNN